MPAGGLTYIAYAMLALIVPSSGGDLSLVRRELPDGLTAIVCARPARGLAAVDIWVRAGSAHERADEYGAAHFLEHLLFKGTSRRKPGEIDAEIERMGGMLNAGTIRDAAHLFAVVPSERVSDALDVMHDALFGSVLAEDQVELERRVILDELARSDDDIHRTLADAAFQIAWGDHAYGRPVLGRSADIGAIMRESIHAFYRRLYRTDRMAVIVVGDVDEEAVHRSIARVFGNAGLATPPERDQSEQENGADPRRSSGPVLLKQRASRSPLALWAWGVAKPQAAARSEAGPNDAILAELASEIVRDATARSPGAGSVQGDAVGLQRGAMMYVWSELPETGIKAMASAVDAVTRRLVRDGPSAAEVEAARRRLLGRRLYRIETVQGLAREIGVWWMLGDARAALDLPKRLMSLTRSDVQAFVTRCTAGRDRSGEPPPP